MDDQTISADRPITSPDGDNLGYAVFAKHLADRLLNAADPEGFVVALNGPWGSGKSSLLNMIDFYLLEREESDQPVVVHFNPWWFSGHEDLARRFFDHLKAGFGDRPGASEHIRKLLGGLGEIVSNIPDERASAFGKALAWLTSKSERGVPELKAEISTQLRDFGKPIVVMIDDIDRLTSEEIRQVFRVVKAVADFPNVIYLLAFDAKIVANALSDSDGRN